MAEARNYVFSHTEVAEMMVKKLDIHEGLWAIYLEFALAGANVPTSPDSKFLAPAAINFIKAVGIQRFDEPNSLTVDAAVVNPVRISPVVR